MNEEEFEMIDEINDKISDLDASEIVYENPRSISNFVDSVNLILLSYGFKFSYDIDVFEEIEEDEGVEIRFPIYKNMEETEYDFVLRYFREEELYYPEGEVIYEWETEDILDEFYEED